MFNERISTHVAEPITATALALEGPDGTHAIWISCDILNIPLDVTDEIRDAVAAKINGFNPKHLLISCTHTHNAPNFYLGLFPTPPPEAITPTGVSHPVCRPRYQSSPAIMGKPHNRTSRPCAGTRCHRLVSPCCLQ
ncbi:MAG: hypothetical protein GX230_07160 [Lentisphaerae bacterium]|nr:hypothetical protein [Lentisphaerota bacterium]